MEGEIRQRAAVMHLQRAAIMCLSGVLFLEAQRVAEAQASRPSPAAIGQIADAIFDTLAGPNQRFSQVSTANRGILFDYERTIGAFQRKGGPPAAPADLRLRTSVKPGAKSVLEDCSQMAFKLCRGLGWSVYVWLDPISVADSEMTVRAFFVWADRGKTEFSAGVAPQSRALLVGFAREVHLARGANGVWRVTGLGGAIAGE